MRERYATPPPSGLLRLQPLPNVIVRSITIRDLEEHLCLDARAELERLPWYPEYLRAEIGAERISLQPRVSRLMKRGHFEPPALFPMLVLFTLAPRSMSAPYTSVVQLNDDELLSLHGEPLLILAGFEALKLIRKVPREHRDLRLPVTLYSNLTSDAAQALSKVYCRPAEPPRSSLSIMSVEQASDPISEYTLELLNREPALKRAVGFKRQLRGSSEYIFTFNSVRRLITCALYGVSGFQILPEKLRTPDELDPHEHTLDQCRALLLFLLDYAAPERYQNRKRHGQSFLLTTQLMMGVLGASLVSESGQLSLFGDDPSLRQRKLEALKDRIHELDWWSEPYGSPYMRWEGIAGDHRQRGFSAFGVRKAGFRCHEALNQPGSTLGMRVRGLDQRLIELHSHEGLQLQQARVDRHSIINAVDQRGQPWAIISNRAYASGFFERREERNISLLIFDADLPEKLIFSGPHGVILHELQGLIDANPELDDIEESGPAQALLKL